MIVRGNTLIHMLNGQGVMNLTGHEACPWSLYILTSASKISLNFFRSFR
jgi:hypothetical protein